MSVTSTHHPFPHLIIFESSPGRQNTSFPFLHPAVCHQTFMSLSLLEDKCTIFQFIWKSFMLCRILLCILIFPNKPRFFFFFLLNCWLLQVLVYIFWYICIVKKYFLWTRHNFHPSVFTLVCLHCCLTLSLNQGSVQESHCVPSWSRWLLVHTVKYCTLECIHRGLLSSTLE